MQLMYKQNYEKIENIKLSLRGSTKPYFANVKVVFM